MKFCSFGSRYAGMGEQLEKTQTLFFSLWKNITAKPPFIQKMDASFGGLQRALCRSTSSSNKKHRLKIAGKKNPSKKEQVSAIKSPNQFDTNMVSLPVSFRPGRVEHFIQGPYLHTAGSS